MKRTFLVLLSSVTFSTAVFATPEGYYLGGFGEINRADSDKNHQSRHNFINDGNGLGLEFGYIYNSRWTGRVEWSNLEFDSAKGLDVGGDRYGIDALYRLADESPIYAIMGVKHLDTGRGYTALNLGLGAEGMVTKHLSAFAEGTAYGGWDDSFVDLGAKMGLRYHFASNVPASAQNLNNGVLSTAQPMTVASVAPVEDADKDGITDDLDLCPDSDPKYAVDQNGCVVIETVPVSIRLNMLFENDSSEIKPEYNSEVQRVAEFMKQHPKGSVDISGHTSAKGSDEYNMALSYARAKAVADLLTGHFGVSPERVTYKGYGKSRLLDSSATPEAAAVNRRIEAVFSATEQRNVLR